MAPRASRLSYAQWLSYSAGLLLIGAAIGWNPYLQVGLLAALALGGALAAHCRARRQRATDRIRTSSKAQQKIAALQLDAFLKNSAVIAWMKDEEGRYVLVSDNYLNRLQLSREQVIGKTSFEVLPWNVADEFHRNDMALLAQGKGVEVVQAQSNRDGSVSWWLTNKFLFRDAGGKALLGGLAVDVTARHENAAKLRDANERLKSIASDQARHLREVAATLQRATLSERERLYALLHDEVQPLLVAARLSLSGLTQATPKENCLQAAAEACEHIGRVIHAARNLGLELNPPLLREHGLNPALEFLCRWVRENHALEVDLVGEMPSEPEDLELRTACFQAVRELLLNVVKHAGPTRATVSVRVVDGETLRITVSDQGRGFDPLALHDGTGLDAIGRRMAMFGGSLALDSQPGEGALATLSSPLRPAAVRLGPRAGRRWREMGRRDHAQDTDRR